MRALIAIVILAVLAIASLALGLFDSSSPDNLPGLEDKTAAEQDEDTKFAPIRTDIESAEERVAEEKTTSKAEAIESPEPSLSPTEDTTILALEVYDRSTGNRVEGFHYVLVDGDRPRIDKQVASSQVELTLACDRPLKLSIEAEGYTPQSHALRFAIGEQKRLLQIQLEPAARATGVTLFITDSYGHPVTAIDVKTEMRAMQTSPEDELRTLWQRNTQNESGKYKIPDLAQGHYRFTVQAMQSTDPANANAALEQRLLIPAEQTLTFYGSEALEPCIVLRDGGQIDLRVFDAAGQALGGQAQGRDVSLRLRQGDREINIAWRAEVDGRTIEAEGVMPAAVSCSLAHPIEAGSYFLDLRRAQGKVVTQTINVNPGMRLPVRVELR